MTSPFTPAPPPTRLKQRLRAAAMCVGAGAIAWRTHAPVAYALVGFFGILLLIALVWPCGYAPISRFLDRLQHFAQAAVTWTILAFVFFLIVLPSRLLFFRNPWSRRAPPGAASFWREVPGTTKPEDFDRSY